jgi:predicted nucleic acid-binding protein
VKRYALDTNCCIDATNPSSPSHSSMERISHAAARGELELSVSLHTLHELEGRKDKALDLARAQVELPHWPIATWKERVGTWKQQTDGTMSFERNEVAREVWN